MPKNLIETKHYIATQRIREIVRALPSGEILPTVSDLCKSQNLSHGTIVYALSQLANEGLIHRPVGRQRYRVIADRKDSTVHVAIIRPDFVSAGLDALLHPVMAAGKKLGWSFSLKLCSSMELLDFSQVAARHDAVLLLPTAEPFPAHLLKALRLNEKPALLMLQHLENANISSVTIHDRLVGRLAAQHLWGLGHRRVLIVLDQPLESTIQERLAGWQEYLTDVGASPRNMFTLNAGVKPFEDCKVATAQAFREYMSHHSNEITGIFCTSAGGASAVLRELRDMQISVPNDVSVIAYAGETTDAEFLYPALTAIEISMVDFCQNSVDLLARQIADRHSPKQIIVIQPRLVMRDSTAAVNGSLRPLESCS